MFDGSDGLFSEPVIVGAGAAGCVLASKLSEDANVSVLLLEAGGDNTKILESKVPIMFTKLFHTEHDWDYYTTEQPNLSFRKLYWPRGRVLGGSTSLNAMMYHHCSKSDFDEWATDYGCDGWSHHDLAPFFRRMEKFTPNLTRPAIDVRHRGSAGDWQTGYSWLSEIIDKGFVPACQDTGIPLSADVNTSDGNLGVTRFQTFIDSKGQRSSLATAFLPPSVLQRPNLYVACHAHVTRILFDRLTTNQPTAIGVEFQTKQKGSLFQVHARKEVILCGGAINTPQTLLLSGIGPKQELERHGIPIIQENDAVGQNLKDHLCPTAIICKAKPNTTLDYLSNTFKALPALLQWMALGRGPLTSNIAEAAAFLRSADYSFSQSAASLTDYSSGSIGPDLEIIGAPLAFIHHGEESPPDASDAFSIVPIILRPQSSGTVTLRNKDPSEPRKHTDTVTYESMTNENHLAIIDPKYLSDKDNNDQNVLLTGLRICLKIIRSPALQKYLESVPVNDDPTSDWWPYSSSNIESISDEDLIRFMKEKAFTLYHPVGTARMGSDPKTSAIGSDCRVHNVKGLRVMDASVFPEQISGHPTATIGAMAYKLSEMIKQDRCANAPLSANL